MKLRITLGIVLAALCAAVIITVVNLRRDLYLVLRNADTGELFAAYLLPENTEFSVEFTHSVNKSPVRDNYEVRRNRDIYVTETWYYAFGAGVQSELNPGETLEYGDDGSMRVTGINKLVPNLIYALGESSDHVLRVNDKEILLYELCGYNRIIQMSIMKN